MSESPFRLCLCEDECGCMPEHRATSSTAEFLRERFAGRRCDSDGVSHCERCNVMYLVSVAERALEGWFRYLPAAPSADTDERSEP